MTTSKPKLPANKLRIALELFLHEQDALDHWQKLALEKFVEWCSINKTEE